MDLSNNLYLKDKEKRLRKYTAIKLPELITENMVPKYVVYYRECYNKEKGLFREFFKIEKHPKMAKNKVYTSSKSNKVNILEKLDQIKQILSNLEEYFLEVFDTKESFLEESFLIHSSNIELSGL